MKTKSRFLALALAAVLAFGMMPSVLHASDTVSAAPVDVTVYVDGEAVEFPAFDIGGRHYFSIADVAYALRDTDAQFAYVLNFMRDFGTEGHPIVLDDSGNYVIFNIILTKGEVHEPTGHEFARLEEGNRSAMRAIHNFSVRPAGELFGYVTNNLTLYRVDGIFYLTLMDLGRLLDFGISANSEDGVYEIDTSRGYLATEVVHAIVDFAVAIDNRENWRSRASWEGEPGRFTILQPDGSVLLSYESIDIRWALQHEYMNVFFTLVDIDGDGKPEIFVHLSAGGLDHIGNFIYFELPVFAFMYIEGEFTQRHLPDPGIAHNKFDTMFFTDRNGSLIVFESGWHNPGYRHIAIDGDEIIMTPILTPQSRWVDGAWTEYIYNHQTGEQTPRSIYVWPGQRHEVIADSEEWVFAYLPHMATLPDEPLARVIPFHHLYTLMQQAVQPTFYW